MKPRRRQAQPPASGRRSRRDARSPGGRPAPPPAPPVVAAGAAWMGALAVAIATAIPFLPALGNGFVWDDAGNVVENRHAHGLGWSQLRWMFTTTHLGHYVPLTWITLGADHVLWGGAARGYHLTNLVIHAAAAALFYLVMVRLLERGLPAETPARGVRPGAAAAALIWAVHPLRVESVAWVTERRDVLSGLLLLAAALAYLAYAAGHPAAVEDPRSVGAASSTASRAYWGALGAFALATLAKSIVVTLPLVLLVLDVYPLRRLDLRRGWTGVRGILVEKIPFLAVSLAAGAMAMVAASRSGRVAGWHALGVVDRLALAAYGVGFYLWKSLLPLGLAPLYEYHPPIATLMPWSLVGGLVVAGVSVALVLARRRWPGPLAAWAAFLLFLAPVSGLLQNGFQTAADRYSYLPSLALAAVAGGAVRLAWTRRWVPQAALAAPVLVVVVLLGVLTWRQTGVWRDGETLWGHALAVAESSEAHYDLGVALAARGERDAAAAHYRRALELRPDDEGAHYNLGVEMARQGRWEEAVEHYRRALEIRPAFEIHANLGVALARLGRWEEAREQDRQALRLRPDDARVRMNIGVTLARQGRWEEAIGWYRDAVRVAPDDAAAHYNWGLALAQVGRWSEAAEQYREVLRLEPRSVPARSDLGVALAAQGRRDEAVEAFRAALAIDPHYRPARRNLEAALGPRMSSPAQQPGAGGR